MDHNSGSGQFTPIGAWQQPPLDPHSADLGPNGAFLEQFGETPHQSFSSVGRLNEMPYSYVDQHSAALQGSGNHQALNSSQDSLHSSNPFDINTMHGSNPLLIPPAMLTPLQGEPPTPNMPGYVSLNSYSQIPGQSLNFSGHHSLSGSSSAPPAPPTSQTDASLQSYAQYHNIYMQGHFGDAHLPAPPERRAQPLGELLPDDDYMSGTSGDGTPIHGSTAPMTPSVGGDDGEFSNTSQTGGRRRGRDNEVPDDVDPALAQHNISAQVVFQALRTVGQTIAMTHENLKLQNQLLAVQQKAAGGNPLPAPLISALPVLDDDGPLQPPAAKRIKLEDFAVGGAISKQDAHFAIQQLEREEEAKINELEALRSKMSAYRTTLLDDGNALSDESLEHRRSKKLAKNSYEAIYFSLLENVNGVKERFFVDDHPKPEKLADLGMCIDFVPAVFKVLITLVAGVIYILKTSKIMKKPPQVGFSFRSYSDSHYTSVERVTPIICKVKEWPAEDDTTKCYRLYHYYLGTQKKKKTPVPKKTGAV